MGDERVNALQDHNLVPVLSVVGGSGVGKSTFVRLCVKEGHPRPIAAPPQSATSTSADIHAYIGRFPTEKQLDVLMLDSEGNLLKLMNRKSKISDLITFRHTWN
jgi:hypothetical protein